MEYRRLGHSGIEVSALSLGSWKTFEFMPEQEALEVMKAAVDAGINFLDDARYDDTSGKAPMKTGYSEVVFGNLLRKGGFKRDELVISNRLWFEFFPDESVEAEVDGSLARIGVDHFDLVFAFTPPKDMGAEELVGMLGDLVATGKVRYWAPGNWQPEFLAECCAVARRTGAPLPPAAMVPYSLLMRTFVENPTMEAVCRDYDIALVPSFALFGGVLTGKYNRENGASAGRWDADMVERLSRDGTLERVGRFVELARQLGHSPTQLALAFSLRHPLVASLLIGATSTAQLKEDLAALDLVPELDDALLGRLDEIFPRGAGRWPGQGDAEGEG